MWTFAVPSIGITKFYMRTHLDSTLKVATMSPVSILIIFAHILFLERAIMFSLSWIPKKGIFKLSKPAILGRNDDEYRNSA